MIIYNHHLCTLQCHQTWLAGNSPVNMTLVLGRTFNFSDDQWWIFQQTSKITLQGKQ